MLDFLQSIHPVVQALLAACFTWGLTSLGAAVVFTAKDISRRLLDGMLGFAAGVMIAASYWSLLAPAIEMSAGKSIPSWFPALVGFIVGGIFLRGIDKILPHLHLGFPIEEAEGIKTSWQRSTLLILAITLHNIPEGLAVSMPLRREGMSRLKSFWYGQLSGIVEPIAGVIGAAAVVIANSVLPYALGFAAGAMIFVVVEEVVPESQRGGNTDLATMSAMIGFSVMMVLDVAFS
ncbi:MAG: ZIP family metal transporter [Candidatus Marinimicrobia bacterium]|nr:ZIP family metal transporter [Candidatus Neomarinimicrobiota bacterium]